MPAETPSDLRPCPMCGERIPKLARVCRHCGEEIRPAKSSDDAASHVIPYKNPQALTAYYLGVFSLIPCLGAPLGLAAIVLGVIGLQKVKRNPEIHGTVHAWIGIVMGFLFGGLWTVLTVIMIIAGIASAR